MHTRSGKTYNEPLLSSNPLPSRSEITLLMLETTSRISDMLLVPNVIKDLSLMYEIVKGFVDLKQLGYVSDETDEIITSTFNKIKNDPIYNENEKIMDMIERF